MTTLAEALRKAVGIPATQQERIDRTDRAVDPQVEKAEGIAPAKQKRDANGGVNKGEIGMSYDQFFKK